MVVSNGLTFFDRISGLDMYSHRNGKYLNTMTTKSTDDDEYVTSASRDIQPGETIHMSYNYCLGCTGRNIAYGTAGTVP